MNIQKLAALAGLVVLLAACAGDDAVKIEPAELVPLDSNIQVNKLWSKKLGAGSDGYLLGLAPVGNGARVFAASADGNVWSFDAITGAQQWRVSLGKKFALSAGPGIGGDKVVVGTPDGQVIAFAINDGQKLWTSTVSSSVLSAPAVNASHVVVRTGDGQLTALDATDGTEVWNVDRRVQGLTLRGNSTPVFAANAVVTGFDNGKVAAVGIEDGQVLWEQSITERRGRNEFERLADVDGTIAVSGEDAFVVGFQGRAALLSLLSGQPVWGQDLSSRNNVALDWNQVFVTTAADEVIALERRSGINTWKQSQLGHRRLSAPAVVGSSVVVGDFEGYLHWLSAIDGSFQTRTRAGSAAITAPPFAMGDTVYVQNDQGDLYAFQKPVITPQP